jgi:L-rhamnose-H+ transport protein
MKERQIKADDASGAVDRKNKNVRQPEPIIAEETAVAGIGYRHEVYEEMVVDANDAASQPTPAAVATATEYKFALGLTVAIVSGILSACFNFGLEAGQPMSIVANDIWKAANPGQGEFLFRNNVIYVVILWGGLTTNLIWCMILNARNKTFGDYANNKTPLLRNYLLSALAGTTWFLQFFFYGMGESKLGNGASSWILHMSFIILIANMWGLISNEWKGVSKKTKTTIVAGVLTIILAVLIVGYGNYLKP